MARCGRCYTARQPPPTYARSGRLKSTRYRSITIALAKAGWRVASNGSCGRRDPNSRPCTYGVVAPRACRILNTLTRRWARGIRGRHAEIVRRHSYDDKLTLSLLVHIPVRGALFILIGCEREF
eukprot:IDg2556t1